MRNDDHGRSQKAQETAQDVIPVHWHTIDPHQPRERGRDIDAAIGGVHTARRHGVQGQQPSKQGQGRPRWGQAATASPPAFAIRAPASNRRSRPVRSQRTAQQFSGRSSQEFLGRSADGDSVARFAAAPWHTSPGFARARPNMNSGVLGKTPVIAGTPLSWQVETSVKGQLAA